MHQLQVRAEQTRLGIGEDLVAPRRRRAASMDGDRQAKLARQRQLTSRTAAMTRHPHGWIGPAGPRHPRPGMDAAVRAIGGPPRGEVPQVIEVHRLVVEVACPITVGETGPQSRFPQRAQARLGPLPAPDIVRPVVHGGDAGVDRLGGGEARSGIGVIGQDAVLAQATSQVDEISRLAAGPRPSRGTAEPSADIPRSRVFQRCQWVSIRPGATIFPAASTGSASGTSRFMPID